MRKKYMRVQGFIETIRNRRSIEEANREITASLEVTLVRVRQPISRENRRERIA